MQKEYKQKTNQDLTIWNAAKKGIAILGRCIVILPLMALLLLVLLWGLTQLLWNTELTVTGARMLMIGIRVVTGLFGGVLAAGMARMKLHHRLTRRHGHKVDEDKVTEQARGEIVAGGIVVGMIYFVVLLSLKMVGWKGTATEVEDVLILFIVTVCPVMMGSLLLWPHTKTPDSQETESGV